MVLLELLVCGGNGFCSSSENSEKIGDPLRTESFTTRGSIIFPPKVAQKSLSPSCPSFSAKGGKKQKPIGVLDLLFGAWVK